jgi:hypothetical protein
MLRLLAVVALVGCTHSADDGLLPGESIGDAPATRVGDQPCGNAYDSNGDGTIDVFWTYNLDERGRDVHDVGRVVAGGPDMTMDSTWDYLDHLTYFVEVDAPDSRYSYTALYDTIGNNVEITYNDTFGTDPPYVDHTVNSDFDDLGHPAQSVQTVTGSPLVHTTYLYDAAGRLVESHADNNDDGSIDGVTTVIYDEVARAVTSTTTNTDGSSRLRVRTYDADYFLRSLHIERVAVDGTRDVSDYLVEHEGNRVTSDRYVNNGTVLFVDTYRYDCR